MWAFSGTLQSLQQGSRNTRQPCGQCGRDRAMGAEISAATATIARLAAPFEVQKVALLFGF
jgi:hypothetical protein